MSDAINHTQNPKFTAGKFDNVNALVIAITVGDFAFG